MEDYFLTTQDFCYKSSEFFIVTITSDICILFNQFYYGVGIRNHLQFYTCRAILHGVVLCGQFIKTVIFFIVPLACSHKIEIHVINIQKLYSFVLPPNQGSGGAHTGLEMCGESLLQL